MSNLQTSQDPILLAILAALRQGGHLHAPAVMSGTSGMAVQGGPQGAPQGAPQEPDADDQGAPVPGHNAGFSRGNVKGKAQASKGVSPPAKSKASPKAKTVD